MPIDNRRLSYGVNKFAKAFAGGSSVRDKAEANTFKTLMSGAYDEARIGELNSKTRQRNHRVDNMVPGQNQFIMGQTGLKIPQVQQARDAYQNGGWEEPGPPTAEGAISRSEQAPEFYNSDVASKFMDAMGTIGMVSAATGDTNAEQFSKTHQNNVNISRQDDMISGKLSPNSVAAAMAAIEGKPQTSVTGSGIAYNPYAAPGEGMDTSAFDRKVKADNAGGAGSGHKDISLMNHLVTSGVAKSQGEAWSMMKQASLDPVKGPTEIAKMLSLAQDNANIMPGEAGYLTPEKLIENAQKIVQKLRASPDATNDGGGSDGAPSPGAQKAQDGNWYVQQNGQWFRVDQ